MKKEFDLQAPQTYLCPNYFGGLRVTPVGCEAMKYQAALPHERSVDAGYYIDHGPCLECPGCVPEEVERLALLRDNTNHIKKRNLVRRNLDGLTRPTWTDERRRQYSDRLRQRHASGKMPHRERSDERITVTCPGCGNDRQILRLTLMHWRSEYKNPTGFPLCLSCSANKARKSRPVPSYTWTCSRCGKQRTVHRAHDLKVKKCKGGCVAIHRKPL
jgi:DNA-directed RNA polymerase subunit M/transcription elongation factor TFIIS